jgi:hypothetical protein
MNLKLISKYFSIALVSLLIVSCSDDDDVVVDNTVTPPSTYKFERSGATSVSYGGQSTRLKMAKVLYNGMKDNTSTKAGLDAMFAGSGFADATLNGTGKQIASKTFASSVASSTVKPIFDGWINDFTTNVIPNWSTTASNGTAGKLTDAGGGRTVYVNAKGHELTQLFTKGLIGGMAADQILNGYLSTAKLDGGTNIADNNAGTVVEGKSYTNMEHYWDEGFGYLYGLEPNAEIPAFGGSADVLLNKYLGKSQFAEEQKLIYDAFIMGRAAIVAKNYTVRDAQAKIIQMNISKVIGEKAMDYLKSFVELKAAGTFADALHALSEGYGFILSLQVTNDGTGKPYYTNAEVNTMLAKLDNFWTLDPAVCTTMAAEIKTKMSL